MADTPFLLNQDQATAKVMGDEAVVINVATGRYYSLEGASCVAWIVLSGGGTVVDAVLAVKERYDADTDVVRTDVSALVDDLLSEQLVIPTAAPGRPELPPTNGAPLPYETICLQKFRDMEELLAFDPPLPQTADPASRPPVW